MRKVATKSTTKEKEKGEKANFFTIMKKIRWKMVYFNLIFMYTETDYENNSSCI
jgi:hypothetical protein